MRAYVLLLIPSFFIAAIAKGYFLQQVHELRVANIASQINFAHIATAKEQAFDLRTRFPSCWERDKAPDEQTQQQSAEFGLLPSAVCAYENAFRMMVPPEAEYSLGALPFVYELRALGYKYDVETKFQKFDAKLKAFFTGVSERLKHNPYAADERKYIDMRRGWMPNSIWLLVFLGFPLTAVVVLQLPVKAYRWVKAWV